ncbi:cathepsin B-like [Culex quinquefasciatus]|uniref:cathepsin B-like n=1 Tax=Culex quinquefasciatus TaxID=7176 RepID=UPI0018E338AA|nr:cathepsin B-like [Culex quinquefasciatus]
MNPIIILLSWVAASASAQLIPASFDARTRWPNCSSIGRIQNQGCCKASHALIPAAVITDRVCIQSNGTNTRIYSGYDALACCTDCSFFPLQQCLGGDPVKVWNYWVTTGLASESCMPLSLLNPLCLGSICPLLCKLGSLLTITNDRKKGLSMTEVPSDMISIQSEILANGPVETQLDVYTNFLSLPPGAVVDSIVGDYIDFRSVKIIGWGTQNNTPYWLIVGSFGLGWGDNGVGMILRGQNFLQIESNVRAGKLIV